MFLTLLMTGEYASLRDDALEPPEHLDFDLDFPFEIKAEFAPLELLLFTSLYTMAG